MNCNKHADRDAAGACVYCGKLFCQECLVEVNGKNYCKDDISKVISEVKESNNHVPAAAPVININNSSSNVNNTNVGTRGRPVPIKSKVAAALLAIFLGGLGAHKFYLGKPVQGILYLVFCWTFIPAFIALIEGIIYLCTNEESFAVKYGARYI